MAEIHLTTAHRIHLIHLSESMLCEAQALSSHYEDVASKLYKASATLKARREAQSRL